MKTQEPRATKSDLEKSPSRSPGDPSNSNSSQINKSTVDQLKGFDHREVARKLKQDYANGARDPSMRHLGALHSLVKYLMQADPKLDEMLQQTAKLIYTQFNIKEVSIGLRDTSDGLFKYVAQYGMRADVWAAHDKLTYTYDNLTDTRKYKPVTISHYTQLFLAEDNPYGSDEMDTFSEHMMKQSKRKSATDSIEGDYIDVFLYGPQDDILGWIEISGTWDGRIPDASSLRCLEIVASILGIAVTRHNAIEEAKRPKEGPPLAKKTEQLKK